MGVEYVLDVRHHRGHADRDCPRIRCDLCGQLITDGVGNVWWRWLGEREQQEGQAPLFAHKRCPSDGAYHEPPGYRLSEDLAVFLVYLVENAGVDFTEQRASALALARLE